MKKPKLQMHNPPHPGKILKELYIEPLEITITHFSEWIGVRRATVSALINGKAGVSSEMAMRLSKAFNTTPDLWLGLQMQYDLWQTQEKNKKNKSINSIKPLVA